MWNDHKALHWKPVLEPMLGRWVTIAIRTAGQCLLCFSGRLQLQGEFVELHHHNGMQVVSLSDVQYVNLPNQAEQERLTLESMQRASSPQTWPDPAGGPL